MSHPFEMADLALADESVVRRTGSVAAPRSAINPAATNFTARSLARAGTPASHFNPPGTPCGKITASSGWSLNAAMLYGQADPKKSPDSLGDKDDQKEGSGHAAGNSEESPIAPRSLRPPVSR